MIEERSEREEETTAITEIPSILTAIAPEELLSQEEKECWHTMAELKKKAISHFLSASKLGHIESMTQLGLIYQVLGYYNQAQWWYIQAVTKGNNGKAMNLLGNLYMEGKGGNQDMAESVIWYCRAVKQGHAAACNNLGMCYEMGIGGLEKDTFKAVELFNQAAEGGSYLGMSNLAYLLACDALQGLSSIPIISTSGGTFSGTLNCIVATTNQAGGESCSYKRNEISSSKLKSEMNAQLRKAVNLFRRAADAGIQDASYQLGRLYSQGVGLPLDPVAAFVNFEVAAGMGHIIASTCCADMLYSGIGCTKDPSEAAILYKYAARVGSDASSMNALGIMYEEGIGIEQNWQTSHRWYLQGAEVS